MTKPSYFAIICLLFVTFASNCRKNINLPDIGLSVADPISIVSDSDNDTFYVLNADVNHKYDSGSILVVSGTGEKVAATRTPRLGRKMAIRGDQLIATFDREYETGDDSTAILFDISDRTNPTEAKRWSLPTCDPINVVARENYRYFAVACTNGKLFMGDFDTATLTHSRTYPTYSRSTIYIDPSRDLLFAFVTDVGAPSLFDRSYEDSKTYENFVEISTEPNDIPDFIESQKSRTIEVRNNTSRFQFVVYDIKQEAANSFSFKEFEDIRDSEMRWLYFNLTNFDGTSDQPDGDALPGKRNYRTNIRDAQASPHDPDTFYIAHAGYGKEGFSEHGNSIVRVEFNGRDPRASTDSEGNVTVPKTEDFLVFKRVYGFKGDQTGSDKYFNSFLITESSGHEIVLVNSFRPITNFDDPRYTIAGATLDKKLWFDQLSSDSINESYYGLALGPVVDTDSGAFSTILTTKYYSSELELLHYRIGGKISLLKTIP